MRKSKLEIQLNRDIREYTDKLWWGMTGRQIFFCLLGLAAGVVLFFFTIRFGSGCAAFCCTLGVAPFIALGMFKWKGLPVEMFLRIWIRGNFMTSVFLPYRSEECKKLEALNAPNTKKGKKNNESNKA